MGIYMSSNIYHCCTTRRRSDAVQTSQQSTPSTLSCGVPQGSVLGPPQFVIYTEDLGELIIDLSVLPLFFADDSQLLASTTPSGVADICRRLERCVSAVHHWCTRRAAYMRKPELSYGQFRRSLKTFLFGQ